MSEPLLVVRDLAKEFRVSRGLFRQPSLVKAVDGVALTLRKGETLSIVGESGCGKSTLLRLILRLIEPTRGEVVFDGTDLGGLSKSRLRAMRPRMQMVFQDPFASLDPRMTVGAALAQPLELFRPMSAADRRNHVAELLELVGLRAEHAGRFPHEFSGGQRQRIGIARALCLKPDMIAADEPVSALDVSIQAQVVNLLEDIQARFGLSYLIVAHDLKIVQHISDRVAVMYLGRVVETAPTRVLFSAPRHPYTHGLMAAIPIAHPALRAPKTLLQGDPPSPIAPPPGCHFHTRCPHAKDICRSVVPPLADIGDGHEVACHRWNDIPPMTSRPPPPTSARAEARLRRLAGVGAG